MKAISLKQPWANMIVDGEKTIETRTWSTYYRGPLLIVSSKKPKIEPAGCIVAIANLVDIRPMTQADEAAACCELYGRAQAWLLKDVEKIEPIPVKGSLGIYNIKLPLYPAHPRDFDRIKRNNELLNKYVTRDIQFSLSL